MIVRNFKLNKRRRDLFYMHDLFFVSFSSYPLFHEWMSLALKLKVILLCAGLSVVATTNTVMLRAHCLGPHQDNHQERPVAWSFTMLWAPPDPGSVHLHSSHHRVLDSSAKSPAGRRQGQGQVSLSFERTVTDSYFSGRPDMLGLIKHSSAVTAHLHLTFIWLWF